MTFFSGIGNYFMLIGLQQPLRPHHVEILNSGSGSKVEAEIQNYPNTEMPKYGKAEMRIFGLWATIRI